MKWAKLGEVCEIKNGYTPLKSNAEFWTNGSIPWVKIEDMRAAGAQLFSAGNHVTSAAVKGKLLEQGTLLLSTTATIGVTSIVQVPCICNQQITAIWPKTDALDMNFLRYFISVQQPELLRLANKSGTVSILNGEGLKKFQIPLPDIETQRKIAEQLDRWEAATSGLLQNLETELSLRQKQFNFCREQALNPDHLGDFEWHTLGDVCQIRNGYTPSKSNAEFWENPTVAWFKIDDMRSGKSRLNQAANYINEKGVKKAPFAAGSVMLGTTSARVGATAIVDVPFVCNQQISVLTPHENLLSEYLYYFLCSQEDELDKYAYLSSGLKVISLERLKAYKIPLPSLETQRKIADLLDRYSAAHSALIANLERERELRSKQARYYKEQLLNFSKDQND